MNVSLRFVEKIGDRILNSCASIGRFTVFSMRALRAIFTRIHYTLILEQMHAVGVESSAVIILTGFFTGLGLAFQAHVGFGKFGVEDLIGAIVALGMTRELGPVLTGLMVTARAGSAMTAELGTMRISEQIDALRTLGIDPYRYLIAPRVLASIIVMPCLTLFSGACGIAGGYIFCTYVLNLNPENFFAHIRNTLELSDILVGLIKSSFFGLILSLIGSYCGYQTRDGTRGVGRSTTRSVVLGSIFILIANYFLSSFLFQTGLG